MTQEFGTKKGILVAKALYQENYFHHRAKAEGIIHHFIIIEYSSFPGENSFSPSFLVVSPSSNVSKLC